MADTGVAVIGGGVVGLAVAARLAPASEVVILERRARPAELRRTARDPRRDVLPTARSMPALLEGTAPYELAAPRVPHARVGRSTWHDPEDCRGSSIVVSAPPTASDESRRGEEVGPSRGASVGALLSPNPL